jgi:hypothetical protein
MQKEMMWSYRRESASSCMLGGGVGAVLTFFICMILL